MSLIFNLQISLAPEKLNQVFRFNEIICSAIELAEILYSKYFINRTSIIEVDFLPQTIALKYRFNHRGFFPVNCHIF